MQQRRPTLRGPLRRRAHFACAVAIAAWIPLGLATPDARPQTPEVEVTLQVIGDAAPGGFSFQKPGSAAEDEEDWWTARAVRGKMLSCPCHS